MNERESGQYLKDLYSTKLFFKKKTRMKTAGILAEKAGKNDFTAVTILIDAVMEHSDIEIKNLAEDTLAQLQNPTAINIFCTKWADTRHKKLEKILLKSGYVAWEPLRLRILTALKTGKIENFTGMGPEILHILTEFIEDYDIDVTENAKKALGSLRNQDTIDEFCQQWRRTSDPILEEILLQANYVARKPPGLRVITALKTGETQALSDMGKESVRFLVKNLKHPEKEIVNRAKAHLSILKDKESINHFCYYWVKTRSPVLENILVKCGYTADNPTIISLLTALKLGKSIEIATPNEETLESLIKAMKDIDRDIKRSAEKILRNLKDTTAIDKLCSLWEKNRDIHMGKIIIEENYIASKPPFLRILTALKNRKLAEMMQLKPVFQQVLRDYFDPDKKSHKRLQVIEKIKETLVVPIIGVFADKEMAVEARKQLMQITHQDAIDFLCFGWAITEDPILNDLLSKTGWVASPTMPILHVMTALKSGRIEFFRNGGAVIIKPLIKVLEEDNSGFSSKAEDALRQLKNPQAIEAFCNILMINNNPVLLKIAIDTKYSPEDDYMKILFFFITEQWEQFKKLDTQKGRVCFRLAFHQAPVAIKKMVLNVAEEAKKEDILESTIIGEETDLKIGEIENSQWEIIVESLKGNQRWDEMKKLIFWAPLKWCAVMANELYKNRKKNDDKDWNEIFEMMPYKEKRFELPDVFNSLTLHEHQWNVDNLVIGPDGREFISGGTAEHTLRLWKFPELQPIKTLGEKGKNPLSLVISPDGKTLAIGNSDKTIDLRKFPGGEYIRSFEGHENSVTCLAFSPDGLVLASGSIDKTVRCWSIPEGRLLKTLPHKEEIGSLVFNKIIKILFIRSLGKTIYMRKLPGGELVHTLEGHKNHISTLSTSPGGKILATGSLDGTICLWLLPDGKVIKILKGHKNWIMDTVITADGKFLISGSLDKTIRFWTLPEGNLIRTIKSPEGEITCLAVSADGKWLLSGGMDKSIRLWTLDWIKPMAFSIQNDLDYVQERLRDSTIPEEKLHGWRFLEVVLKSKFNSNLQFDDQSIFTGDFTIALE